MDQPAETERLMTARLTAAADRTTYDEDGAGPSRSRLRSDSRTTLVLVVGLLAIGGALRFYRLSGRSLWLDEVLVWDFSGEGSVGAVVRRLSAVPSLMPLHFLITWMVRRIGDSEFWLRLFPAIAGTLAVAAMYGLGKALFGRRTGLIAALLVAVTPFLVWYSQENAAYALLLLLTIVQMHLSYLAVTRSRLTDWLGFSVVTLASLYNDYLALTATAAAFAFIALALAGRGVSLLAKRSAPSDWHSTQTRELAVRAVAAVDAGLLVVLGYLPWFDIFRTFLQSQQYGLSRFSPAHHATVAEVQSQLATFGFEGVVLVLFAAGLVAAAIWTMRHTPDAVLLAALWLAVPLAAFFYSLRGGLVTLWPRYLIFLVPAALLFVAIAIDEISTGIGRLGEAVAVGRARRISALASVVAVGAVLIQVIPSLAWSYQLPKDDWRGAAGFVASNTSPDSVVIDVGTDSYWVQLGMGYYLHHRHSPILLVDAGQPLDPALASRLASSHGTVWVAFVTDDAPDEFRKQNLIAAAIDNHVRQVSTSGVEVRRFTGVAVVRLQRRDLPPTDQAMALLSWSLQFQPSLVSVLKELGGT
jgi:mannosyltransferase